MFCLANMIIWYKAKSGGMSLKTIRVCSNLWGPLLITNDLFFFFFFFLIYGRNDLSEKGNSLPGSRHTCNVLTFQIWVNISYGPGLFYPA